MRYYLARRFGSALANRSRWAYPFGLAVYATHKGGNLRAMWSGIRTNTNERA